MILENLPAEPQKRKAIVLLDDVNIIFSFKSEWINSPNITVLEYPFDSDSPILENGLYKSLEMQNLIEKGAVLSQSPYDFERYMNAKKVEELISCNAKDKYLIFSGFCKILGATKFYGRHIENEHNSTNSEYGGKAGYKITETEFQMNRDLKNRLNQDLEMEDAYYGEVDPNIEPNIEEAKKYLIDNHVSHDKNFTSLLDARTGSNKIKSRKISFSLTSESTQYLKIIGSIKYALFNAEGKYENKVHTLKDLKVTLNVDFGKG